VAIEGDTVAVHTAGGRTLATAVGPAIPWRGSFPIPSTAASTFTITFTNTAGEVPLGDGAFTIVDEYGHIHHPRVTLTGGGLPPARISRRRTLSLTLGDVLPAGDGQLRWAPGTSLPVVSWDFDVEVG
jgi:hypothetical protein